MKRILLALMMLIPMGMMAQEIGKNPQDTIQAATNTFDYVCETPAVVFYINPVLANSDKNPYTIWEKRVLTKTAEGQQEALRIAKLCPDLKVEGMTHYYVKQIFDVEKNRTKALSFYFFKNETELGDKQFSANAGWYDVQPGTVTAMEMDFVKRAMGVE